MDKNEGKGIFPPQISNTISKAKRMGAGPMVRGVNKKMVEVVEMDHEYFERAILIVRPPQQNREEPLLGQEASLYIKNLRYRPSGRRQLPAGALMAFRLGAAAAAGAGLMALLNQ
jgi:hypothetical protein